MYVSFLWLVCVLLCVFSSLLGKPVQGGDDLSLGGTFVSKMLASVSKHDCACVQ